jgi:hypothetical protein
MRASLHVLAPIAGRMVDRRSVWLSSGDRLSSSSSAGPTQCLRSWEHICICLTCRPWRSVCALPGLYMSSRLLRVQGADHLCAMLLSIGHSREELPAFLRNDRRAQRVSAGRQICRMPSGPHRHIYAGSVLARAMPLGGLILQICLDLVAFKERAAASCQIQGASGRRRVRNQAWPALTHPRQAISGFPAQKISTGLPIGPRYLCRLPTTAAPVPGR